MFAVVANDLSGLTGTTEVVSNETNRGVTGDSDNTIQRGIPAQEQEVAKGVDAGRM